MSRGAIRNFMRMKPANPDKPAHIVVDVEHIVAYKRHGWENNMTEIILINGHSVLTKETPEEFEKRLLKLVPTYHID